MLCEFITHRKYTAHKLLLNDETDEDDRVDDAHDRWLSKLHMRPYFRNYRSFGSQEEQKSILPIAQMGKNKASTAT